MEQDAFHSGTNSSQDNFDEVLFGAKSPVYDEETINTTQQKGANSADGGLKENASCTNPSKTKSALESSDNNISALAKELGNEI